MSSAEPLRRSTPEPRRNRAPRLVLFVTVFIDLLGFGIVIPFLPMYAQKLNVGAFGIGLILAIYSLAQFVAAPILGRISDRVGRRPVILLGLLGSSISYIIYGFAGSFASLMLSRAVHGACAGTVSTAQAYIADTTTESERAHGMGMIGAAFGLGFVLGPAIGGALGYSHLRVPVFFAAAMTFANLVFAAIALPESHQRDETVSLALGGVVEPLVALPRQLTTHRLAPLFAVAFLGTLSMVVFEATFAIMVPRVYGFGIRGIGALMAYAGLIQAITQGYLIRRWVKRVGEERLIRWGLVALASGLMPMAATSSAAVLMVLLLLLSVGYGLVSPSIASLISKRTEKHLQGETLGINQSALSLARICGPVAGGLAYQLMGPTSAYVGGGLVAIAALAIATETNRAREAASRGEEVRY